MGSLLNKKTKATSTNTVNVPDWLDSRNKELIDFVDQLYRRPYESYGGERVAGFNEDQMAAFDLIRGSGGRAGEMSDLAYQGVQDLFGRANGPSSSDIEGLMNPYLEQVLNATKRQEAESQQEAMARLKRESALAGSFGGSRFAVQEAMQRDRDQRRLTDIDYSGRYDAYNQALNQYNTNTGVLGNAIQEAYGYTANDPNVQYAQMLLGIGGQQQMQDQTYMDVDYQDWLTEQAYPYEQAQFAQSFFQPYSDLYKGSTTTQTSKESGNILGKLVGMGTAIASGSPYQDPAGAQLGQVSGPGGSTYSTPSGISRFWSSIFGGGRPSPQNQYIAAQSRSMYNPALQGPGFADGGAVKKMATGGPVRFDMNDLTPEQIDELLLANPDIAAAPSLNVDMTGVGTPDETPAPELMPRLLVNQNTGAVVEDLLDDGSTPPEYPYSLYTGKGESPAPSNFWLGDSFASDEAKRIAAMPRPEPLPEQEVGVVPDAVPVVYDTQVPQAPATVSNQGLMDYTQQYIDALLRERNQPKEDSNYQKYNFLGYEGKLYMPMFKAGLAMMASDGDFFDSLAAGGNAFAGQLEASSSKKEKDAMEGLDLLGKASEAERQVYNAETNRYNAVGKDNPYTTALKQKQLELENRKLLMQAKGIWPKQAEADPVKEALAELLRRSGN